jgi:L-fuconolactonase
MPAFPIIDSHVHLWDPQRFRITWIDGDPLLDQAYGLEAFHEHTRGVAIEAFVYLEVNVEPAYALLEARHIAGLMAEDPRLRAIVAWAPLEHGTRLRSYLEALTAIDPRIRGVRRVVQGEPDPGFSARPDFVRGVQLLPEFGLSCDICIKHHQLAATIALVRQCPEVQFVLDHIGKPDIAVGQIDPWRAQIAELAALPNVVCKISGMVTEADHQAWTPADLAPYVAHVIDVFGEDRVLFGGDWPVALLASGYQRWVETLDALTAQLSDGARRKLWAENARRIYRL